ncbi:MAG: acetylglutamate kinase [Chloroflexi bacterium]|nr:acetylglutamate kinase [Chloroflexota bacterium]
MSELLVVKLGGTTVAEQGSAFDALVPLARERPVVVVHGGGKRVTTWLERLGIETAFHDGLRITDERSLEVAAAVLRGAVNTELVAALGLRGCPAVGLSGVDGGSLLVERVPDLGLVGSVRKVRSALLKALLAARFVPVIAPLGVDRDGVICNVNADDAAAGLARGLQARQLVLLTDVDGIRDGAGHKIDTLTLAEAEGLIADGTIGGGMVPKIRSALAAIGTSEQIEAVIADASAPNALQRALTEDGFGTRVRAARAPAASSA